jgi:uncharacterized protein (DUF2126 family)
MAHTKSSRIRTERRTPTPAKITLAGDNNCDPIQAHAVRHTRPTPAPRIVENAYRTFTVGISHFVHRSSVLQDLLLKDSMNGTGRLAGLELGGEWMCA